ncbi:MAG: citrate synthase family protein [Deltaproteobacteria bacterium]|nr:citrate synthase family protein [Deltaproteobacteria bacterium]
MAKVDQRGFDNQPKKSPRPAGRVGAEGDGARQPVSGTGSDEVLLTAAEAVRFLNIKKPTLYAYVSRGLVRSVTGEGRRARKYVKSDLERLRVRQEARSGHGPVAAAALRWGEPVLESAISDIGPGGPRYAGHAATTLAARGVSFERVAELLWTLRLPEEEVRWPQVDAGLPRTLWTALIPKGTPPSAALSAIVAALAVRDPDRFGAPQLQELARSRTLIRRMVASLAMAREPNALEKTLQAESIAESLGAAVGAPSTRAATELLNLALVLWADHELNASTFTARVTASAGADLYACVGAALGTHSGTRHGGSVDRVEALIEEIGRPERVREVVRARLARGEVVDGFGHLLYPHGDPRAVPLLQAAHDHAPRNLGVRTVLALVAAGRERGEHPNVDLATVAVGKALGLARGQSMALFAIGRSAGWVAHILEQRTQKFLVRPRARYVGP